MAIKTKIAKAKIDEKIGPNAAEKAVVTDKMVAVSFRTRQRTKLKAEKVFADMGISMTAALNMFLAQVVREKGMPFVPSAKKDKKAAKDEEEMAGYVALEELWEEM